MNNLIRGISRSLPAIFVKGLSKAFIVFTFFPFLPVEALAQPDEDTLAQMASPEFEYANYAQKGQYENDMNFSEVPQWHYYDKFGNKILDGYQMYGLSKAKNDLGGGGDNLALHSLLYRWLNGVVQAGDIQDNGGVLAMIGDRIKSQFTPFSFNQTLFAGARFDVFIRKTSLTFLTSRISHTGDYGINIELDNKQTSSDWLTGLHLMQKIGESVDLGGTYANIHHEEGTEFSNPYSGVDTDPSLDKTPTGLSLYGLNGKVNLEKVHVNGEYLRSQEFLDGEAKTKGANVIALNGDADILEKLKVGGEFYSIGSRFKTDFSSPTYPMGDVFTFSPTLVRPMEKYHYSLVEDNDDRDEFPENGRSRYMFFTRDVYRQGDPDGTIPETYDKDKNGVWDYEEDFLTYDSDPPESKILFDRNHNGAPDIIEDDAYPDYPYVPSYYLPGERYYRYDDVDEQWLNRAADSLTHKGLFGLHLNARFKFFENLELTLGGIYDRSQEKTFQTTYENGLPTGETFDSETALDIYLMAHFKKDIAIDKYFIVDNLFRKIQDNIPNHTLDFEIIETDSTDNVEYTTVIDELEYRNCLTDELRAEFCLFKNRGLNYTGAGKFEFQKHLPKLEFNYTDKTITSFILINKLKYIISIPFFDEKPFLKDMFIIPKYKNVYSQKSAGSDSLNAGFNRNDMTQSAALVLEWKITEKSAVTAGGQIKRFDDFRNARENYWEPCYRLQYMLKDRFSGMAIVLTTGFTQYSYHYDIKHIDHNPWNNPHRVSRHINAHEFFIYVHAGI